MKQKRFNVEQIHRALGEEDLQRIRQFPKPRAISVAPRSQPRGVGLDSRMSAPFHSHLSVIARFVLPAVNSTVTSTHL